MGAGAEWCVAAAHDAEWAEPEQVQREGLRIVEPCYRAVGYRIRSLRLTSGMTLAELGEQLEPTMTAMHVSHLERGHRRIQLHHLVQIARIFDVAPATLLNEVF